MGRCVDEGAGSVEHGNAVRHLEADGLEAADLLPECLALVAVAGRDLQAGAGPSEGAGGAGHSLRYHHLVEYRPSSVLRADQVLGGHAGVTEVDAAGAAAAHAHQPVDVLHFDCRATLDDEGAYRFVRGSVLLAAGIDEEVVRPLSADDEALLAVEHPTVAVAPGLRRGAEEVGAAAGLGEGLGNAELALECRAQPARFLLRRAEGDERLADDGHQAVEAGEACAEDADLLDGYYLVHPFQPPAAVFLGEAQPQQAPPGRRLQELTRIGHLPRVHIEEELAGDFVPHELAHFIAQLLLVSGKQALHVCVPPSIL